MAIDERTGEVFCAEQAGYRKPIAIPEDVWLELGDLIHRPGSMDVEEVQAVTDAAVEGLEADEEGVVRGWVQDAIDARPYTI